MHIALVDTPIDTPSLIGRVASHDAGITSVFIGTVRNTNDGRAVLAIEYSAYHTMALHQLRSIGEEASARFDLCAIAIEHRLGLLALGDASVVIALSHARRTPGLDATRWVIESLKQRVPIWKREHYVDGTREWVDPTRSGAVAGADRLP